MVRFVISSFYFVIAAILNSFIIFVLSREGDFESTKIGTVLYNCLAFVDIAAATVFYALEVIYAFQTSFNLHPTICHFIHFLYMLSFNISAWLLFTIALNKFIFVQFPLRYYYLVTSRRTICLLLISGILSLHTICDLPITNFPFTGVILCSIAESANARTNTSPPLYAKLLLGLILIPIVLTVVLNFALVSIAVKQSRLNRRVDAMAFAHLDRPGASEKEPGVDQGVDRARNRAKRRGLLNVVYLVKTALVTLIVSIVTAYLSQTREGKESLHSRMFNDFSYFLWSCKNGYPYHQ